MLRRYRRLLRVDARGPRNRGCHGRCDEDMGRCEMEVLLFVGWFGVEFGVDETVHRANISDGVEEADTLCGLGQFEFNGGVGRV